MKELDHPIGLIVTSAFAAGCGATPSRADDPSTVAPAYQAPALVQPGASDAPPSPEASGPEGSPTVAGRVFFEMGSATLGHSQQHELSSIATRLHRRPNAVIFVDGYADEPGGAEFNLELGKRRARRVAMCLEELGVLGSQIHIATFGREARPEGSSKDPRLVEISVQPGKIAHSQPSPTGSNYRSAPQLDRGPELTDSDFGMSLR